MIDPHRRPCPPFALLPFALLVAASVGCSSGNEEGSAPPSYDITYAITAPAPGSFHKALITVSGTLKVNAKVPASGLRTMLRIKGKTLCEHWAANHRYALWAETPPADAEDKALYAAMVEARAPCDQTDAVTGFKGVATGKTFSFTFDSGAFNAKNKPLTKDGKLCVSLSSVGKNAQGQHTICVILDNTPPKITVTSPAVDSVHIGVVQVSGTVKEKNLKQFEVQLGKELLARQCVKGAPKGSDADCDLCKKTYETCLSSGGPFSFTLDRSDQPTEPLELRVVAVDATNQIAEVKVPFKKLKAPRYQTAREDFDGTLNAEGDTVKQNVDFGTYKDFDLVDVNHDGLLDAVLASSKGMFVRHGLPHPTPELAGKKGWARFGKTIVFATGDFTHVQVIDLDGDGHDDVVATGTLTGNISAALFFLTRKDVLPKRVAQHQLGAPASALAHADLDNDGQQDVIVGSEEDAHALTLLYLHPKPLCPTKADPTRTCDKVATAGDIGPVDLVAKATVRKLLAGVASIATADFFEDDSDPPLLDIAVGRDTAAVLSVCRNTKAGFEACIDMTKTDFLADMPDTAFIHAIQMNDDDEDGVTDEQDIPDLIITSKTGTARWVSGDHKGAFQYLAKDTNAYYRTMDWHLAGGPDGAIQDVKIAPIGPDDEDYLIISLNGRTTTMLPVAPDDDTAAMKCYPTYVLGRGITRTHTGDLDLDGQLDLVGLISNIGLAVAEGKGGGRFRAARIYRSCRAGFESDIWDIYPSPLALSQYRIVDLTDDGHDDLILIGYPSKALGLCPAVGGAPPAGRPALFFTMYINSDEGLIDLPRGGEYAPHATSQLRKAAGVKDLKMGGCGDSMPPVTALEFGEFNGSSPIDMVTTYARTYAYGGDAEQDGDVIRSCVFHEVLEVMNIFGEESSDDKENLGLQCKLFDQDDEKKETPLKGFGGGAYLTRASLNIWINGDPAAPFGMDASSTLMNAKLIKPTYAQSAGSGPIAAVVGKFDEDDIDDVATLMAAEGTLEDKQYLAERIRLFKGDGKGKVSPIIYLDKQNKPLKELVQQYCKLNQTPCTLLDVPHSELSPQPSKIPPAAFMTFTYPSYRIVAAKPIRLQAASFCKDEIMSLFTLSRESGDVTVVRQQGGMRFELKKSYSVTDSPDVFRVSDVNQDGCSDLLVAGNKRLGFTPGTEDGYKANEYFPVPPVQRNGVATLDVNADKIPDLLVVNGHLDAVELYLGDGNGQFIFHNVRLYVGVGAGRMSLSDLDGDGCADLVVQGLAGVTVLTNLGCAKP